MTGSRREDPPLLYGWDRLPNLIAVNVANSDSDGDEVVLVVRDGDRRILRREPLKPFLIGERELLAQCPVDHQTVSLEGPGPLNARAVFRCWKACEQARKWAARESGCTPSDPVAPYAFLNDPVHQYLLATGRTLFGGMSFEDLRRLQLDIECLTTEGFEFCNPEREGDRIIAIGLADSTGWSRVLAAPALDEKTMLEAFVQCVRERDPDVIEGHNLFNFDLVYLVERARRHGVTLGLGRDGSEPTRRSSRFSVGERTVTYDRFDVFGRHIVDTYFLAQAYDVTHRSLEGFGLKEVAAHFGLTSPDRTDWDGAAVSEMFRRDPEAVVRYVCHDVEETRALANLLARSFFLQTQMLPFSYQNVCVRGTAAKIDALMEREYLRRGAAWPKPSSARPFEGGYADLFLQGVVRPVHHVDVRSLYPSLMLLHGLGPRSDHLGVFLQLLEVLRDVRLEAKRRMQQSRRESERMHYDALQTTFKVLINSFYGYLGFAQARFNDFDVAEQVAARGRKLLRDMVEWLRARGAQPVEIDTDGIYFIPPAHTLEGPGAELALKEFRHAFAASLPKGLEVEFDGEYPAMFSYRTKNYALLDRDGTVLIKGAALKSRGLEPFQRQFMEEVIRLMLDGRDEELPKLKARYETAIRERQWPIRMFAKTEMLQDSPSAYAAAVQTGRRPRSPAYELALRSGRDYRAGDQVSYYVTGTKKNVSVHESARLISEWDPNHRDENVAYYLAKLDALYAKLSTLGEEKDDRQGANRERGP